MRTGHGSWALRAWPAGSEEKRLRFVHRALLHVRSRGFRGVPALATTDTGDTVLRLSGRLFDAQEWMAGEPLSGRPSWGRSRPNLVRPLDPGTLELIAATVARFHGAATGLEPEAGESVTLETRLAQTAKDVDDRSALLTNAVGATSESDERHAALDWLDLLPEAVGLAENSLGQSPAGSERSSTLCHGDLWGEHVLSDGRTFVNLVDFESVHFGSPAFDLAQLILHFNGWGARGTVLRAYTRISALGSEDEAAIPAAAAIDLVGEGCWSLSQLYGGDAELTAQEKAAHEFNLRVLSKSLEAVVADLR